MKAVKKILNNIFIDGLSGIAIGLFSTLIIGTILKQVGDLMGSTYGVYLSTFAVIAQRLTGAGIGIGVAYKFRESTYVLLSAAAAGMIGAYASNLIAGTLLSDTGALVLSGPGEPLWRICGSLCGNHDWKTGCWKNKTGSSDHTGSDHPFRWCSWHPGRFPGCQNL